MQFLSNVVGAFGHFLGSIFHVVGAVLVLIAIFKLLRATEKGDITGSGLQAGLYFLLAMVCFSM